MTPNTPMLSAILSWSRSTKRLFVVSLDLCMSLVAMWLAFSLRLDTPHSPTGLQWLVYGLGPTLALPIFIHAGLYRAIFRYTGIAALITTGQAVALYGALLFCILLIAQWEGVPRSAQESMAIGRPVITTDVPGCRETVVDGVNGFMVPPWDAVALAQAMERFIQNPSLVNEMGRKSREIAEQKFDVRRINKKLAEKLGVNLD